MFTAQGAGLQIPPLSSVQIEYHDEMQGWIPIFYGEVRQGGNTRDETGEDYILRGLAQRLKETLTPPGFTTPQQPAHLTVRALIQMALSGGAGLSFKDYGYVPDEADNNFAESVIVYDELLCPDLGFDCRPIKDVSGQFIFTLLERIAQDGAGFGVNVVFGVRPDRKFFCKPARTNTLELDVNSLIGVEWKPPVSEVPVTAVQWYVGQRPNGTWLTHSSTSPKIVEYGARFKPVPLDANAIPWLPAPATYTVSGSDAVPNSYGILNDGNLYRDGLVYGYLYLSRSTPGNIVITLTPEGTYGRLVLDGWSYGASVTLQTGSEILPLGPIVAGTPFIVQMTGSSQVTLTVAPAEGAGSVALGLLEFRVDYLHNSMLDRMAEYHYVLPAVEPADIEAEGFIHPFDVGGRVKVGGYERAVDCWEYRLTDERGLTMGVLTGQADDPYKLAQAALIKRQSTNAVIAAVTALG